MARPISTMELPANTATPGKSLHSGVPAFRLINSQLGQVKKLISEQLVAQAKMGDINRLLESRLVGTRSGKMLRPGLVLLTGASCGKITGEHIRVAAVIEMIHNATLLHDDVIDEGRTRRGLPTINSIWGNESAVLLGDFLLGRVFKMCAELEPWVGRTIAAAAVRVCEGELRQLIQRQNWQLLGGEPFDSELRAELLGAEPLSESEYIDIITEKSAALFSCCCSLGGLLARADEDKVKALSEFGLNAGIAFQITDDLLDIIGDETKAGKTLGSDAGKNKLTLATIHFLKTAQEKEKAEVKNTLNKDAMIELLNRYGSLEYTHKQAMEFAAKAVRALAGLKKTDAKDALIETAKFMADRTA
jgi:octaprenyl-diphosphate synthase